MSERMQWSEAEAVVRAYRAEHGVSDGVDVATLARALGTDVTEIRRLAGRQRRFIDRSGLLSAGIAVTIAAVAFALVGPALVTKNPLIASLLPSVRPQGTVEAPALPPVPAIASRMMIKQSDGDAWIDITKLPKDGTVFLKDGKLFHYDEPL